MIFLNTIKQALLVLVIFQSLYSPCIFSASLTTETTNNFGLEKNIFDFSIEDINTFHESSEQSNINIDIENKLEKAQEHINNSIAFLKKRTLYESEQELVAAKKLLNQLLIKEQNIHALNGLAIIALLQKDNKTALNLIEKSLTENNYENDKAIRIKARILLKTGDTARAEQLYLQLLIKNNKDIPIYLV